MGISRQKSLPWIDKERCLGCTNCKPALSCPQKAIIRKNKANFVDLSLCASCGLCELVCPFGSIKLV